MEIYSKHPGDELKTGSSNPQNTGVRISGEEAGGPIVSVIIPVYNKVDAIKQCLQSVVMNQSLEKSKYEVIIIDDGSTDGSEKVCDQIECENVRVFHQENKGVSYARNRGINLAQGSYVCFVDSDDTIENEYLERMLEHIDDADLVMCTYYLDRKENAEFLYSIDKVIHFNDIDKEDKTKLFFNTQLYTQCNKLFNIDVIRRNSLYFDETIKYAEDGIFSYQYLSFCNSLFYIHEPLYHYRMEYSTALQKKYDNVWRYIIAFSDKKLNFLYKKIGQQEHLLAGEIAFHDWERILQHYFLRKQDSSTRDCLQKAYEWYYPYFVDFIPFIKISAIFDEGMISQYKEYLANGSLAAIERRLWIIKEKQAILYTSKRCRNLIRAFLQKAKNWV